MTDDPLAAARGIKNAILLAALLIWTPIILWIVWAVYR